MRRAPLILISALLAVFCAACGSSDAGGQGKDGNGDVRKVTVAYVPAPHYAPLWQAQEKGYFKDEGLEVTLKQMAGGVVIIPALESGDLEFGGSDVVGALSAVSQNVPVKFIASLTKVSEAAPTNVLYSKDKSLASPADFKGKRIAVNAKFNVEWLMVRRWLQEGGVDPNDVEIVEVPFPDMIASLQAGQVDAAALIEPFVTLAEGAGLHKVADHWSSVDGFTSAGILGNTKFMADNADTVAALQRAIAKATSDLEANPTLVRTLLPKYTAMDPALAQKVTLPTWQPTFDVATIAKWADYAQDAGIIDHAVQAEDLVKAK